ncbi:3-keto-disaccharide hydrolase [Calycomorphotria hydatis]|uniref:3-keto-alpha-glucoside-1,2-lyase/3-keto-2-hydroxy-glucal hydratase domain-containing protein n=1 Tax=Calycomorphotria hydatis TaxID=2528027 RepID=A0A517T5H3_9PLAN|nr:DUF1080 domain-containing protein [Calycomorphotria hydatis]QDT63635.1 hypothetical protein V22_08590 [Calycomorphotria hydatis]
MKIHKLSHRSALTTVALFMFAAILCGCSKTVDEPVEPAVTEETAESSSTMAATDHSEAPPSSKTADESPSKAQQLFNGETLSGWRGDDRFWSVKDGVIVGTFPVEAPPEANTFLIWDGEVSDFELTLKFRITGNEDWANSGVQYRSSAKPKHGEFALGGYQADIDLGGKYIGILYEEKGRGILSQRTLEGEFPNHIGEWNDYRVIANGPKLTHEINGVTVMEYTEEDAEKGATKGLLGLQLHRPPAGKAMTIEFKDIELTE